MAKRRSWSTRAASGTDEQRAATLVRKASIALFKAQGALVSDTQDAASALVWTSRALIALAEADSIAAAISIARRVVLAEERDGDSGCEGD